MEKKEPRPFAEWAKESANLPKDNSTPRPKLPEGWIEFEFDFATAERYLIDCKLPFLQQAVDLENDCEFYVPIEPMNAER